MRQLLRLPRNERRLDGDFFGIGAFDALLRHAEDGIANGKVGHPRTQRRDHAGKIAAEDVGKVVKRITSAAPANFIVGGVDAGGNDIDHRFAGTRGRIGCIGILQFVGAAMARE